MVYSINELFLCRFWGCVGYEVLHYGSDYCLVEGILIVSFCYSDNSIGIGILYYFGFWYRSKLLWSLVFSGVVSCLIIVKVFDFGLIFRFVIIFLGLLSRMLSSADIYGSGVCPV